MINRAIRHAWPLALAASLLVGCGAPADDLAAAPADGAVAASAGGSDLNAMDASQIGAMNNSGDLDGLDDQDFAAIADAAGAPAPSSNEPTSAAPAGTYATQGIGRFFTDKTKVGIVRSVSSGVFALQTKEGWIPWKRHEVSLDLQADDAHAVALSNHLNGKVLIRGPWAAGSNNTALQVDTVLPFPSLAFLTDFLTKGRVAGKVFDAGTKQPLRGANVQLVSTDRQYIYRAISKKDGDYYFKGLPSGSYQLTVQLAGYAPRTDAVQTAARHKTEQYEGLMSTSTPGTTTHSNFNPPDAPPPSVQPGR